METTVQTQTMVTIVLNDAEAAWLRGVMQNPLFGETIEEEDEYTRQMRRRFFDAMPPSSA